MAIGRISRIRDPEGERRMNRMRDQEKQRLFGQRRLSNQEIKQRLREGGHDPMDTRSNENLNDGHFILHSWDDPEDTDWSEDDIVLEHKRLSRKMEERGMKHKSALTDPYGDGHDSRVQRNAREEARMEAMAQEKIGKDRRNERDLGLEGVGAPGSLGEKAELQIPESKDSSKFF